MNEISFRTALRQINKLGNVRCGIDSPLGFLVGDSRDIGRGESHMHGGGGLIARIM